jgi:hypothetical protein
MPRLTRDLKFQKSFDEYFSTLMDHYSDLQQYSIVSTTENKNLSEQYYTVTIPREIVSYYIDVFVVDSNGIVHPPGPVMKKQNIPNVYDLIDNFETYFQQYELRNQLRKLSFVHISDFSYQNGDHIIDASDITEDIRENEDLDYMVSTYDLKINIMVIYHKTHIPFPVPLTTKEEFEQKCKRLEIRNAELIINVNSLTNMYQEKEEQYNILRRRMRIDRRNIEQKYQNMFEKMQKKFREFYKEVELKDDCPVCYEVISVDNLKVPGCCHTICSSCAGRCTNCPICRESY